MRLTSGRAKAAMLHPEQHVRDAAAYYFSRSFSLDAEIAPLAIKAISQYGQEAFRFYSFFEHLAHTEETVLWMIGQLAALERPPADDFGSLWAGIASALSHADPETLHSHLSEIQALDGLDQGWNEAIEERIAQLSMGADELWTALENFCAEHKDDLQPRGDELEHAERIAEALARHPGEKADQVISVLREEIDDVQGHPMLWLEPFAIQLAGLMRLDQAVPEIVGKLQLDADLLNEECRRALARIGTDSVVKALAEEFPAADCDYCFMAICVLEDIHTDLAVQRCFDLLEHEEDEEVQREIYKALLINGATEAFEPARQWLLENERDPDWLELRSDLITAATMMEVDFPEFEDWKENMQHDRAFCKKWYAENLSFDIEQLAQPSEKYFEDDAGFGWETSSSTANYAAGRNDPCPCGSGKKYKKCCLRERNGSPLT